MRDQEKLHIIFAKPLGRKKKYISVGAFALALCFALAPIKGVAQAMNLELTDVLQVKAYTLSNGLTVWLNEDHSKPQIFGAVVINAGARDCPDTGIAHYFEHIMFKGTDKIGTINYESEKVFLDSIAVKYEELAETQEIAQRTEIQKEINRLSIAAAEYAIPNEYDVLISEYGGSGLNAYTSYDATVYLNTFSPPYIEQWAELNSERLIAPVYRLFQSELETVYEEKNMYNNQLGYKAFEKLTERALSPSQYAYSILGSTEHLKNPRLSEMDAFFAKYYVASNMGLILTGDFDAEAVLPILEKTFSRIPRGEKPERPFTEPDYFKGKETFIARVKIPVIKLGGFIFPSMTQFDSDYNTFSLIVDMLGNTNTGYLNQLKVDGKLTMADVFPLTLNKTGVAAIAFIPKIPFQSFNKAQGMVWNEINRIKTGDFTDEMLEGAKLGLKSSYLTSLEDADERAQQMINCFTNDVRWEDFLSSIHKIDGLTKEEVVRVANKYLTDDYLQVQKKYGDYPNDNIQKPPYAPIIPPNKDSSSVYAETLKTLPVGIPNIRIIDFKNDVQTANLRPHTTLYVSENPVNDIFTLKISYGLGQLEDNRLSHLAHYLGLIGTDSLSFEAFREALYSLGADISFDATTSDFIISVKGFDRHFEETIQLVGDFMRNYKVDTKKLKSLKDIDKMNKTMKSSASDMGRALLEKIKFGDESRYLKKVGKVKAADISVLFEKVLSTACNIHYCGTNQAQTVESQVKRYLPVEKVIHDSNSPIERESMSYDKPVIYFLDMPKTTQSIIYSYIPVDALESLDKRYDAQLFTHYMGGGMTSVMFQEIREFRSLAYSAGARIERPVWKDKTKKSRFITYISTQNDKTYDALLVLDSLLRDMPFSVNKMATTRKDMYNELSVDYPMFRDISSQIAELLRSGYEEDPTKFFLKYLEEADMGSAEGFYNQYMKHKPVVYCLVGDSKKMNMKRLEDFGTIIRVKKKDIFKW